MRKIISLTIISVLTFGFFLLPTTVDAETLIKPVDSNDLFLVFIDKAVITEPVSDNAYLLGPELEVEAPINNNLLFLGGSIEINATITNDFTTKAGTVIINENIYGDVRIIAERVIFNNEVIDGSLEVVANEYVETQELVVTGEKKITSSSYLSDNIATNHEIGSSYGSFLLKLLFSQTDYTFASIYHRIILTLSIFVFSYFVLKVFPVFSRKTLEGMKEGKILNIAYGMVILVVGLSVASLFGLTSGGLSLLVFLLPFILLVPSLSLAYTVVLFGEAARHGLQNKQLSKSTQLFIGSVIFMGLLEFLGFFSPIKFSIYLALGFIMSAWTAGAIYQNKFK